MTPNGNAPSMGELSWARHDKLEERVKKLEAHILELAQLTDRLARIVDALSK